MIPWECLGFVPPYERPGMYTTKVQSKSPNKTADSRVILNYFFASGVRRVCVGVRHVCARLGADGYLCFRWMS